MRFPIRRTALLVGVAAAIGGTAIASAEETPIKTTDAVVRKASNINLSPEGKVNTTIVSLTLAAGSWVIHADDSVINFGAEDFLRCQIEVGGLVASHTATVGKTNSVATISGTVAVKLAKAETVTNTCSHDKAAGSTSYVDAGADMWAHKAGSLTLKQEP